MVSYRKQYVSFNVALQKIKPMPCLSPDDYEAYHDHTDIRLFHQVS